LLGGLGVVFGLRAQHHTCEPSNKVNVHIIPG